MNTQISVMAGLAELKLLDSRINKAIGNGQFMFAHMNGTKINGSMTPEEATKRIKSDFESIEALLKRRNSIKAAIVASNAVTMVEIGGIKMTVAEAIERKSSISYEESFVHKLRMTYNQQVMAYNRGIEQAQDKAQQALNTVLGKESSGKTPTKEDQDTIYKPVFDRYKFDLIDPLKLEELIINKENYIETFNNEVDHVLATSNAVTLFTI